MADLGFDPYMNSMFREESPDVSLVELTEQDESLIFRDRNGTDFSPQRER